MKKLFILFMLPVVFYCQKKSNIDTTNKYINVGYDKFYDVYTYDLKKWILLLENGYADEWQNNLVFGVEAYKNGETKKVSYDTYFLGRSRKWRYKNWDEIILLVDGKRLKIKITEHNNKTYGENLFLEKLIVGIKNKDFITIANAKIIEGRVGIDEFKWTYKEREDLREMIRLINMK